MHRIDGAGATVDNKFTDGDPVGGVQATVVTDYWLNDVQEELMSILTAGGITPVKGTQDQVLKAIRTLSVGVIGSARNVKMSVAAASASATITADQIFVGTSLSGQVYRLASLSKSINLATTGAGGMDTGTAPASGYVAIYAIYNPTTATSALLATNATSAVVGEVYGGANMPSGYTASALVAVWPTDASKLMKVGFLQDRQVNPIRVQAYNANTGLGAYTPVVLAAAFPPNAKVFIGDLQSFSSVGGATVVFGVGSDSNGAGAVSYSTMTPGQGMVRCPILTPQTIFAYYQTTAGTPNLQIWVGGYIF